MDEKIKIHYGLKWALVAILAVFAYASLSYVNTYSKSIEPSAFRSFSVSGEGKVVAIPDVVQFTFSVITEGGMDLANLQAENTGKTNKIIDFIKSQGVEDKDIKTESYNVQPRYQYYQCNRIFIEDGADPCPPAEIVGYTISQTVLVKARDFSKVGEFLAGAVENGANSVSQLSFTIDDRNAIENQAREQAIKKAKEKAKSIAEAGGFRLGRLLSIEEGGFTPYPVFRTMEAVGDAGAKAPIIEPGSNEITSNVVLKYEIK